MPEVGAFLYVLPEYSQRLKWLLGGLARIADMRKCSVSETPDYELRRAGAGNPRLHAPHGVGSSGWFP